MNRSRRWAWLWACCALACGGKYEANVTLVEHASRGGSPGSAGVAGSRSDGGSAGSTSAGGVASLGGAGGASGALAAGGGDPGGSACALASDCPSPSGPCVYAACIDRSCRELPDAPGTFIGREDPPNCFATVCDDSGNASRVVDSGNVPLPGICQSTRCDANGQLATTNQRAGAPCSTPGGGVVCDGAGQCVACLDDSACGLNQACSAGKCVPASGCSDGRLDGDETDVDCGGSCTPCPATRDCATDADCATLACDRLLPHRCLRDHCADHHLNADETDNDCGGSCKPCDTFGRCKVNADCSSGYCDPLRDNRCLGPTCLDGVKDYPESDVDCGGGTCDGCALGQACFNTWDCLSAACDLLTLVCIQDHCLDHRLDGDETDVDCGGPTCTPCALGKKCIQARDCSAGLTCPPGNPHLCLPP